MLPLFVDEGQDEDGGPIVERLFDGDLDFLRNRRVGDKVNGGAVDTFRRLDDASKSGVRKRAQVVCAYGIMLYN